jgi:heat shock protein HslJ
MHTFFTRALPRTAMLLGLATILFASDSVHAWSFRTSTPLEGTLWKLTQYLGPGNTQVPALAAAAPTGVLQGGVIAGSTGCNQYTGTYTLNGTRLSIEPGATTLRACPEPIMTQEQVFLAALRTVTGYTITGTQLVMTNAAGSAALTFVAAPPLPLATTTWLLTAYNNGKGAVTSVLGNTQITAVFGTDGAVTGSAGCNDYRADYTTTGSAITIGMAATTRKFCASPPGVMDQEQAYLTAITHAAVYRIRENELQLTGSDGATIATFIARPAAP